MWWTRSFYSASKTQVVEATSEEGKEVQATAEVLEITESATTVQGETHVHNAQVVTTTGIALSRTRTMTVTSTAEGTIQYDNTPERPSSSSGNPKRFSFKRISFSRKPTLGDEKPALSTLEEHEKREQAKEAAKNHKEKELRLSKSDLRAKKNALRVRVLITGEPTGALPAVSPVVAKPQLNKIKSQLSSPKTANKLIQELRQLPATSSHPHATQSVNPRAPIHAVCLEFTDAEEESLHFAQLRPTQDQSVANGRPPSNDLFPSIVSAPVEQLTNMLSEMHVVELIKSPDLGIGQPGDGPGILAGAVPTPETVLKGVKEITPQLMALGYATGRAFLPDHSGVYPPTDRISVLTYWWGLEVLLPPPTLDYLSRVQSITSAIVNFLSAMALVNNGVREILPFVRYIGQFIEYEFNGIKAANKGKGVVCAATWIMPAALVPRPWDFPEGPPPELLAPSPSIPEEQDAEEDLPPLPPKPKSPKRQSTAPSLPKPRPVSSILDIVGKPSGSPVIKSESASSVTVPPAPTVSVSA